MSDSIDVLSALGNSSPSTSVTLFGICSIDSDEYYLYRRQTRTSVEWMLTTTDIINITDIDEKRKCVIACLKTAANKVTGWGRTYLLTRLNTSLGAITYLAVNNSTQKLGFLNEDEYVIKETGEFFRYKTFWGGKYYNAIEMNYEGFKINLHQIGTGLPVKMPKLLPVEDKKTNIAIINSLGIQTAAMLFKRWGDRLNFFKNKKYILIDTLEKFQRMLLDFLTYVQEVSTSNKSVLVGLDTETTGLNMFNLSEGNAFRDSIVAIPFAWKDNEAYLICTDMYFFSNIADEEIYPVFEELFSRNPDYSGQDIAIDYCNQHFSFNRSHITVGGFNVIFDEMAFLCHGCHVFFDEDGRQLLFNLDTDLAQGSEGFEGNPPKISNSLKSQTGRLIGDEPVELDELFGKGNEDKFRYLQDPQLALIYGGADADYTRQVIKKAIKMTEPALYQQYRKYDMTLIYRLAEAAWNGMPIDSIAVREQGDKVKQDLERLKDFIYHFAWLANKDTIKERLSKTDFFDSQEVNFDTLEVSEEMFRYPFTPANHKRLLFDLLHYPILKRSEKSGEPALDKYVLKKLMAVKRKQPANILVSSLMSTSDPTETLIDKDDFNTDEYPLARVFSTYATLNKEYSSYYKPIVEHDLEGHAFYSFTLARAATRRILSPGQTMKGSLKSLVIAPKGQIFMSFDASQIEYRHMASLAYIRTKKILQKKHPNDWEAKLKDTSIYRIFTMMQKEEADYHIETASTMTGVKQYRVKPKVRKQWKHVGFGRPYGLSDMSMCENLFGEITQENMAKTRDILKEFDTKQKEIIELLNSTRDTAFMPAQISDDLRKYLNAEHTHVGIVRNFCGFYRLFILENLTRARTGRIRRQAGNCIIQGGAAELFRRMLYNFWIGCVKAGIHEKIHWLMTVHDELDATVDDDIDIMKLIKVLYECCTLRYKDHIPYYIGINFGANWYDAKADANELPVIMVQRMIAAYDEGNFFIPCDGKQSENLLLLKRHFMCDRIKEELSKIIHGLAANHKWTQEEADVVDEKFENYIVRAYLSAFSKSDNLLTNLQDWQAERDKYGFNTSFLSIKFKPASSVMEMSLDDTLDIDLDFDLQEVSDSLTIELLSNESEETNEAFFDERSLFDPNASSEDMEIEDDAYSYYHLDDKGNEEEYVINEKPTNAFDIYVPTKYIRSKVLRVDSNTYSVLLAGTPFFGEREKELHRMISQHFDSGSDSCVIIGDKTRIIHVKASDNDLDWLDKLLTNRGDTNAES